MKITIAYNFDFSQITEIPSGFDYVLKEIHLIAKYRPEILALICEEPYNYSDDDIRVIAQEIEEEEFLF